MSHFYVCAANEIFVQITIHLSTYLLLFLILFSLSYPLLSLPSSP